jgi:CDP-glycerol glycerophosphotransferase (TagB/SpsB family)
MLNKKLKKLIRDPNLFFSDMVSKQKKKYAHVFTKKLDGHYQYTIISAVYNVQGYLDCYFNSIINQTLNFKKSLHLILVDDGSTDKSGEIIKKWQHKHPNNITYLRKENGGQASARNLGLEYVTTEWVTFLDPDDFLDVEYFLQVDDFLNKHKNVSLASCNVVFYIENGRFFKDTHPLNYKYKSGNRIVSFDRSYSEIQLSASSSIFKTQYIKNNNLTFCSDVKPNFEDGRFISEYLLSLDSGNIAFLQNAKYYYRKREDGSSTLDTAWTKLERFTHVTKYGYLYVLEQAISKLGFVPKYLQYTILYEIVWNVKYLVNHPERLGLLSDEQKKEYLSDIKRVFRYIDAEYIHDFNSAGCWFYHKVGMLACFKNEEPVNQIAYVENYDFSKDLVLIRYFTKKVNYEHVDADGNDLTPVFAKTITHDFVNDIFILERRLWVSAKNVNVIKFFSSDIQTRISLNGKQRNNGINVSDIKNHFHNVQPKYNKSVCYQDSWLLMDRDSQADDNAEHLYRYIKDIHPEQKIYFVLRKKSHDWQRLLSDGFKLIEFGTKEHESALMSCSKVISSHADKYVTNYLGPRMLAGRHYVFLQHGVTKDDISGWLNQKEYIDCLITSSKDEYNSIANDGTRYNYGKKEVALTGFPRHDKFLHSKNNNERKLIIMPTWRLGIVGAVKNGGNEREVNPEFMQTTYAKSWSGLLKSPKLKELCETYNFNVIFFPHANIQCYLDMFEVPEYIEIVKHSSTTSIQSLFIESTLMITDYSSVAFEMAIQNKQTLYYQFDEDECFNGGHIYAKGYFDYRRDGFGAVSTNEDELLASLELAFKNDGLPDEEIITRINSTFAYHDNKNCERVYNAIKALDAPLDDGFADLALLRTYALQAMEGERWDLAETRWKSFFLATGENQRDDDILCLAKSLRMRGKFRETEEILRSLLESETIINTMFFNDVMREKAQLHMFLCQWDMAINIWNGLGENKVENKLYCTCLAYSKNIIQLQQLVSSEISCDRYLRACLDYADGNWKTLSKSIIIDGENLDVDQFYHYHLLLQSHAFVMLSDFDSAHQCLVSFERIIKNDVLCRYQISRLAFLKENYNKTLSQLQIACSDILSLPAECLFYYISALVKNNKDAEAVSLFNDINIDNNESHNNKKHYARILGVLGEWDKAVSIWSSISINYSDELYDYAVALKNTGDFYNAYQILCKNEYTLCYSGWNLRSELAQLNDDWDDAYLSWRKCLQLMPSTANAGSFVKLQRLKFLKEVHVRIN